MVIIPRVNSKGETVSVTLLNVSITDCENVKVVVAQPNSKNCIIMDPYSTDVEKELETDNGAYSVTVDTLNAWKVKTIAFI